MVRDGEGECAGIITTYHNDLIGVYRLELVLGGVMSLGYYHNDLGGVLVEGADGLALYATDLEHKERGHKRRRYTGAQRGGGWMKGGSGVWWGERSNGGVVGERGVR